MSLGGSSDGTRGVLSGLSPASGPKPGPVVVSVCVSCAGKAAAATGLLETLRGKLDPGQCEVRAVQCLGACNRRVRGVTVAVSATDGFTFVFGDLAPADGSALVDFIQCYRETEFGLVPWERQPQILRSGLVVRLPPPAWSGQEAFAPP